MFASQQMNRDHTIHHTSRLYAVMANPPVVYFEVDFCPLSRLPHEIKLHDKNYTLFCITYGNGRHIVGCVLFQDIDGTCPVASMYTMDVAQDLRMFSFQFHHSKTAVYLSAVWNKYKRHLYI